MRYLIGLILLLLIALGAAYVAAGRGGPPSITIAKPEKWGGVSTPLEVDIGAPDAPPPHPATTRPRRNSRPSRSSSIRTASRRRSTRWRTASRRVRASSWTAPTS